MIVAAAVCPHPPLLHPDVDVSGVPELLDVRSAARAAVAALVAARPDRLLVLGTGPRPVLADEEAGGTLAGHGPQARAGGPSDELPLALTLGAWLADDAGWRGPRTYATAPPVLDDAERVAVLAMADGSARRSLRAPGHLDERAEKVDAQVATALRLGDPAALAGLDVALGDELMAAGTRSLVHLGRITEGARVTARLRYDDAPLGVGYWVADWVLG